MMDNANCGLTKTTEMNDFINSMKVELDHLEKIKYGIRDFNIRVNGTPIEKSPKEGGVQSDESTVIGKMKAIHARIITLNDELQSELNTLENFA